MKITVESATPIAPKNSDRLDAVTLINDADIITIPPKTVNMTIYNIGAISALKNLFTNSKQKGRGALAVKFKGKNKESESAVYIGDDNSATIVMTKVFPWITLETSEDGIVVKPKAYFKGYLAAFSKKQGYYTTNQSLITIPMQLGEQTFSEVEEIVDYINTVAPTMGYKIQNDITDTITNVLRDLTQVNLKLGGSKFKGVVDQNLLVATKNFNKDLKDYLFKNRRNTNVIKPISEAISFILSNDDRNNTSMADDANSGEVDII